jgi:superfamily II DNA/RNA helicase
LLHLLESNLCFVVYLGRTGRKRNGRVVCLVSKGQEERKLKQAEESTKMLWQALKNPARFQFKKNIPMLPEHPTLLRKNMDITTKYRMSQIGGHDLRKPSSKKSRFLTYDCLDEDVTWRLSSTQDQDRRKLFGRFEGGCFNIRESMKSWRRSIPTSLSCLNDRPKRSIGHGRSSHVLRMVELLSLKSHESDKQSQNQTEKSNFESDISVNVGVNSI